MIERLLDKIIHVIKFIRDSYNKVRLKYQIKKNASSEGTAQNLEFYNDPKFENMLNTWGIGTVWTEIQYFLVNYQGKVLDIACGSGAVINTLKKYVELDVFGCDLSKNLIDLAVKQGVSRKKLTICNAVMLPYFDNYFDFSYSLGSLHLFTEEGIEFLLKESHRVTKEKFFFQIQTSKSGKDEGWIKPGQHFHNNSVEWWIRKCENIYNKVYVLDSAYEDSITEGKWFICIKNKI